MIVLGEDVLFFTGIFSVIVVGALFIAYYVTFKWKVAVIVLRKLPNNTYFFVARKHLFGCKDFVKVGNFAYELKSLPTLFHGDKMVYYFVEGNARPLSFNEVDFSDALMLKRIVKDNVIYQLVQASRPALDLGKMLPYIIILVIVIVAVFVLYPYIGHFVPVTQSNSTTTIPTIVPTITPPKP